MKDKKVAQFVEQIRKMPSGAKVVIVPSDLARAAADFIERIHKGAARGGANARGRSGRKVRFDSPAHAANRQRVAKSRGKNNVES